MAAARPDMACPPHRTPQDAECFIDRYEFVNPRSGPPATATGAATGAGAGTGAGNAYDIGGAWISRSSLRRILPR